MAATDSNRRPVAIAACVAPNVRPPQPQKASTARMGASDRPWSPMYTAPPRRKLCHQADAPAAPGSARLSTTEVQTCDPTFNLPATCFSSTENCSQASCVITLLQQQPPLL